MPKINILGKRERNNLKKFKIDYPLDFRRKETKKMLISLQMTKIEYIQFLRDLLEEAQGKEVRYTGSIFLSYTCEKKDYKFNADAILSFDTEIKTSKSKLDIIIERTIKHFLYAKMQESEIAKATPDYFTTSIYKVRDNGKLEEVRMRDTNAGLLDGYDKQNWDTNTGKCVFDYIINCFQDIKGFKSVCNYNSLNKIFNDNTDEDLLSKGVNTIEISRFCKRYNIPMYAIDDCERTFYQYQPPKPNKKCPALIYRISNQHFYPITNTLKKKSITKITSLLKNTDSEMILRQSIEKSNEEDVCKNGTAVENLMKHLAETLNNKIVPQKFGMVRKQLVSYECDNVKYVENPDMEKVKQLCENMDIPFSGQGSGSIILECIKRTGIEKLPKSTHNPYVFKTLIDAKKDRVHYGFVDGIHHVNMSNYVAWDINSCYTACMYNPSYEWLRLDFNDDWEDYDGVLKNGLYYVITDDTTLFKKSNYYSTVIIQKAIQENINFTITKQLIPSHYESVDLFKKIIDKVVEYSKGDKKLYKLPINMLSGLLGQSEKVSTVCKINSDIEQIMIWLKEYYSLGKGIFINKIPNTDYFLYGYHKDIYLNETNIPMYIQVLDQSNVRLYDMIKTMGGRLIARKTDLAVVDGIKKTDFKEEGWGTYKSEKVPHITKVEDVKHLDFHNKRHWKDYDINDSDDWEKVMKVLTEKGGLLLQANAGNGKTYCAKQIANKLGNKVKILAPTNKASLNIGGSTIHKFLKMTEEGYISSKLLQLIKKTYKYIIIDEISMITKELWKRLCLLKQETGLIFMLIGDNKQCPPVEDEKIEDYFNHPAVKYLANNNRNILTVMKRYDIDLYNTLKDVNNIDTTKFELKETQRNICYFNKTRIAVNEKWNKLLKHDGDLFIPENINDEYSQDMYIYNGLPVISKQTKRNGDDILFANSETFTVKNYDERFITVWNERPDENGVKEIYIYDCPVNEFSKYFMMNYCSTTHKCQGETITDNYTIYDWNYMNEKLKYTAMSRAKSLQQISFNEIKYEMKKTSFEENINNKLKSCYEYDNKKKYHNDITTEYINTLFIKQNGDCVKCGCMMKTSNYSKGDKKQFSIDRIDSTKGHVKGNIQLLCWSCNRAKKNRW